MLDLGLGGSLQNEVSTSPDFRILFESVPGLYLVLTKTLEIVAASEAYLDATMTGRDAILGKNLFEVFPDNPDDPNASGVRNLHASLRRVLQNKVSDTMAVQKYDIRRPESKGGGFEERFWSPRNLPVLDTQGEILYIIHRVEDVTDFVRLKQKGLEQNKLTEELRDRVEKTEGEIYVRAQELQEANRQLRTANEELESRETELKRKTLALEITNKELESFTYSVSHDLRAPLRAIDGFSRMLLEDCSERLSVEGKRFLDIVRANTQKMGQLIDDLLTLSRLGRLETRFSTVDMDQLVKEVLGELERDQYITETKVTVHPLPTICGDRSMLRQVFINVISNAIKFSRKSEPRIIEIGSRTEEDKMIYWVKDNGVGFDMRYSDKLFGVFQRLHSIQEFEGTGVGLAISHRIIQKHEGRIWAEAKVNEGATFHIALPALENENE